jgi:hypothetical protein
MQPAQGAHSPMTHLGSGMIGFGVGIVATSLVLWLVGSVADARHVALAVFIGVVETIGGSVLRLARRA